MKTNKKLTDYLTAGKLNSTTFATYDKLIKQTTTTESKIKKMFAKDVQKLAKAKYVTPAKSSKKDIGYDLARYELVVEMEEQLSEEKYDEVKRNLTKYNHLPSTFSYAKTEVRLTSMVEAIEDELQLLEAEQPAPQVEEPVESSTPDSKESEENIAA